ncbi:MAG: hypothetical protein ACI9JP_003240, partial [Granulosicoccus sp.]
DINRLNTQKNGNNLHKSRSDKGVRLFHDT